MKVIFTLCAFLVTCCLFAQNNFRSAVIGLESNFYDVVQMSDDSYICVGENYSPNDNTKGLSVAKFNSQGQLLISRSLIPDSFDKNVQGIAVIKTLDGGIAVSGNINDTICLLKLDASLGVTWHKQLVSSNENRSFGARLIQTSDGGYIVTGIIAKDTGGGAYEVGTAIKTNSAGNVVWAKQYFDFAPLTSENRNILDIAATTDGGYMMLAHAIASSTSLAYDSTYLIKINSSGNLVWSKFVNTNLLKQSPISLISTSDGNFLVCGSITRSVATNGGVYSTDQAMMIKLNQNGDVIWSKTINNPYNYDTYLYDVTEDIDGGYIACGQLDTAGANTSYTNYSYLLKVSSSGNLVWTRFLSTSSGNEYLFGATPVAGGGFAVAGNSNSYNNNGSVLFNRGIIYKFGSDYSICGTSASYGTLSDFTAATVSKPVTVYDLNTSALSTTLTSVSAGSDISLCSTLPVQLLSFTASLQNKSVRLEWKTTNEVNTDHFTVERSSNRAAFTAIQTLYAKGSGTAAVQTYTTTDLQPLPGTSYYRLKQVDKNGTFAYSGVVPVTISASGAVAINPNPVRNEIRVLMQSAASGNATLSVTDMTGKVLLMQTTRINAGANSVLIQAAALSKGLYVLKINCGGIIQSVKFVKE